VSAPRVRLPADIEMEDRLAFGLTARQLVILALAALVSYGVYAAAGSVLPPPVAVALAAPTALAGVGLALGRLAGLSGDRIALAAARHLLQARRRVAGEKVAGRLADAPEQPGVSLLRVPVRTILASGVVELVDGTSALLLAAAGTNWALRSEEEQEALADAYAKWLNSLIEPTTITVRSEPVDLNAYASKVEDASRTLPHPALRRCAHTYAQFLTELASEGDGLRRRQIVVVLTARKGKRETTARELERRAGETTGLLAAAGVELEALDGQRAARLLLGSLEPPGPPAGSHMDGVIHRC
jgi:PrgI family protein